MHPPAARFAALANGCAPQKYAERPNVSSCLRVVSRSFTRLQALNGFMSTIPAADYRESISFPSQQRARFDGKTSTSVYAEIRRLFDRIADTLRDMNA
jgi:hypothetical protein